MNIDTIILFIVIQVALFGALFLVIKKLLTRKEGNKEPDNGLLLIQNQISEITKMMDAKLGESHQATQHQSEQSMRIITDVT